MKLYLGRLDSPVGPLRLVWCDDDAIRALHMGGSEEQLRKTLQVHYGPIELIAADAPSAFCRPLEAYFSGELTAINSLPVQTAGTPFQRQVWAALREIPAGTTTSYGQLAARIGRPSASRAVGLANGSNPVGIVVPCHRVIGANGTLTGYAGGLDRKRWLLQHERAFGAQLSLV